MIRLGRQVPMPRIGRSSPDDTAPLTDDELYAALAAILDQPRDDRRRQPPLPRYGRDSSDAARDLISLLAPDDDDLSPSSYFRPAPRGGRYKRSLPEPQAVNDFSGMEDYNMLQGFGRAYRAVPFARIGRNDGQHRLQAKAVAMPRIGRAHGGQGKADRAKENKN